MGFRQKIIGILLIIVGVYPLISEFLEKNDLFVIYPDIVNFNIAYQFLIVLLGIWLFFSKNEKNKSRLMGTIIIIVGLFPFFFKIDITKNFLDSYSFLNQFIVGGILYHIIIILLGAWLLFRLRYGIEPR